MMSNSTYDLYSSPVTGYYPYPFRTYVSQYAAQNNYFLVTSTLFDDIMSAKYIFLVLSSINNLGSYRTNLPLITTDETMSNYVEALIQRNSGTDLTLAISSLKTMCNTLDLTSYANTAYPFTILSKTQPTTTELTDVLLFYKRIRFFCEGLRWFDIKRHQLKVNHVRNGVL